MYTGEWWSHRSQSLNSSCPVCPKRMAASSLLNSTFFFSSSPPPPPSPYNRKSISFPSSSSKSLFPPRYSPNPLILSIHQNSLITPNCNSSSNNNNNSLFAKQNRFFFFSSAALDSLLLLCASLALSISLFVVDVDSASAFVVTTPRKLQTDELATVRLFQENTPSVVYITNLAVKYYSLLHYVLCALCLLGFDAFDLYCFVLGRTRLLWTC